ncbi:DUF262 domain-containing protein [Klebsiella quasipneumoniae]|uniref:DUF262 domain-containing protein n=1 Tax=Klebsiella quasipneumoniae TaxID=1463165 RepID=UPI00346435D9
MQISFDRKTITNCLQQNFVLPTFQRDYKWELKHLQDLMSDIQDSFFDNWEPDHGRRTVLGYAPYFLGTIIVTPVAEGANLIVDGQQRITTPNLYSLLLSSDEKFKPRSKHILY